MYVCIYVYICISTYTYNHVYTYIHIYRHCAAYLLIHTIATIPSSAFSILRGDVELCIAKSTKEVSTNGTSSSVNTANHSKYMACDSPK